MCPRPSSALLHMHAGAGSADGLQAHPWFIFHFLEPEISVLHAPFPPFCSALHQSQPYWYIFLFRHPCVGETSTRSAEDLQGGPNDRCCFWLIRPARPCHVDCV